MVLRSGRIKLICLALGGGLLALPASAQGYRDCRDEQRSNQVAGTVIGGLLGGVFGSNIAGRGHRGDGAALGAVVGAVAGSAAGAGSRACPVYGPAPRSASTYGGPYDRTREPGRYGPGGYDRYGDTYPREAPIYSEHDRYGGYERNNSPDAGGYADDRDDEVDARDNLPTEIRPYGRNQSSQVRPGAASSGDNYYGSKNDDTRECRKVDQTTRLPDGTQVTRTAEACRPTHHGEWTIRD
jgi:hypothetical protein